MEMVCSVCGISGKMRILKEVISSKGLVLSCGKCALEEGFPSVKKPDKKMLEAAEKRKSTVYETMVRISGVRHKETEQREREKHELKKQEASLKKIVDMHYEEKLRKKELILKSRPDLADNFHWIIMRVRRIKGLTQGQLAEKISETEAAIKMAEQGVVPEGYELLDKLQRFLNVRLIKQRDFSQNIQEEKFNQNLQSKDFKIITQKTPRTLSLDRKTPDSLTIADLRRMRLEKDFEEESEQEQRSEEEMEEIEEASEDEEK